MISWSDFEKIDMRVGTIIKAESFPEAKKPAYILTIDFGPEIGIKKSSAQITSLYNKKRLKGEQVIAVVNFPPKQIGPFISECLVMGIYNEQEDVVLLRPQRETMNGCKVG
ncbi:tRNA-binding protein [Ekhidna lutea]|uniref:tRNA-binding protein n=1 Tax=Ekhidna lutea TaxID=447679 RepID=A0A239IQ44_EKHLU|nr:tRNA-binding protein [Ekhidna lutea]SNS95677.1 tRNA-binding protein [Ekhidna lutea]